MKKVSPSQGNVGIVSWICGKVKVVVGLVVVFAVILAAAPRVGAEDLSDEKAGRISMGCASIKKQLGDLQKADSRMRVYLGSKYQIVLNDFMTNLNLRLVKNNMATERLTGLQTTFSSERERFKADFTGYSQALEALIGVDCMNEPQKFYDQLEVVRAKRADVQASSHRLNDVLGWHRSAVEELRSGL